MIILTLRTDKPEAEIGLFEDAKALAHHTWQAHYELAETIHAQLRDFMQTRNMTIRDLQGIVVFKGPGSFTGLRIGLAVTNALAASYQLPIVGQTDGEWQSTGAMRLLNHETDLVVLPEYGSDPHITAPKQ